LSLDAMPGTFTTKDVNVIVYIEGDNGGWLSAMTKATLEKVDGNLKVTVDANEALKLCGEGFLGNGKVCVEKTNSTVNSITTNGTDLEFNAAKIINEFADNPSIGDTIRDNIVKYVTTPNKYNVYLVIQDSAGNDFIGNELPQAVSIEAYDNTISTANAVQVELTVK